MQRVLGAIATGSLSGVEAGEAALRAGGNAVDAVIAATFATAIGDPAITSLAGGGALTLYRAADDRVTTCDFFAAAPGIGGRRGPQPGLAGDVAADDLPPLDFFGIDVDFRAGGTTQRFHIGRGAAALPGVLPGLASAAERFGRLSLAQLVEPTVKGLRTGVPLTAFQVLCNQVLEPILRRSELGRELLLEPGTDRLRSIGSIYSNPRLAATLERVAAEGLESWRREVADAALLSDCGEKAGGWITSADLAAYRPVWREPIHGRYRDWSVHSNPAPAFGGRLVVHTLRLLERVGASAVAPDDPRRTRRVAAAFRAVAEVRAETTDLLSRGDGDIALLLDARLEKVLAGAPPRTDSESSAPGNTVHASAVDSEGNAASLSISHGEGNGHEITGTGLLMNNLLGEEDLFPGGLLRFVPGRRLSTMMAPTVLRADDGTVVALGSGGSNRIRTVIPQVVLGLVDDRLSPREAAARGRLHYEAGRLSIETFRNPAGQPGIDAAAELAHEVRPFDAESLFFGGVHVALRRSDGQIEAGGDPRRSGCARRVTLN